MPNGTLNSVDLVPRMRRYPKWPIPLEWVRWENHINGRQICVDFIEILKRQDITLVSDEYKRERDRLLIKWGNFNIRGVLRWLLDAHVSRHSILLLFQFTLTSFCGFYHGQEELKIAALNPFCSMTILMYIYDAGVRAFNPLHIRNTLVPKTRRQTMTMPVIHDRHLLILSYPSIDAPRVLSIVSEVEPVPCHVGQLSHEKIIELAALVKWRHTTFVERPGFTVDQLRRFAQLIPGYDSLQAVWEPVLPLIFIGVNDIPDAILSEFGYDHHLIFNRYLQPGVILMIIHELGYLWLVTEFLLNGARVSPAAQLVDLQIQPRVFHLLCGWLRDNSASADCLARLQHLYIV